MFMLSQHMSIFFTYSSILHVLMAFTHVFWCAYSTICTHTHTLPPTPRTDTATWWGFNMVIPESSLSKCVWHLAAISTALLRQFTVTFTFVCLCAFGLIAQMSVCLLTTLRASGTEDDPFTLGIWCCGNVCVCVSVCSMKLLIASPGSVHGIEDHHTSSLFSGSL